MLLTKIHALEDRLAPDSSDLQRLIMARDCKQTRAYCIPAERIMVHTVARPSLRVRAGDAIHPVLRKWISRLPNSMDLIRRYVQKEA